MRPNLINGFEQLHYKETPVTVFIFLTVLVFLSLVNDAYATESCLPAMARVVSVQGVIELRRAEKTDWEPAIMNTVLCAGDRIRTRSDSRASLRLSNKSMLRLKQRTTVTFPKVQTDKSRSLLDLINGVIHIITRTPVPFKVRTPFVNAAVEGTEFLVNVSDDNTRLVVYEGQVRASNDYGDLRLVDNEAAIIFQDQAPQKDVIVRPTDAVQWALHYPTIMDHLPDYSPQDEQSANFLIRQAGRLLTVGNVDEAKTNIKQALTLEPDNSDAYSLQTIIAVVQNNKDQALNFATQAVELDPSSATAKLALSYAQQAHFDLEDALATVHEAVKLGSLSALAWARLAELQMSVGHLDQALDAAQQAVRLNPDIAKTRTVLGFAYLLQINTEDAKTVFNEAILLDQTDPMPRLGLGLALIREGELEAGRIELEIAASLDPANSLIRSYLGKAYFEEKRYPLASTQFDIAKERDPQDPTPWFYDAILKQTQNRPIEALQDIQKSIELNDNRAVYRSQLLLDQDQAGRGSSLARIFDNLGFEKRALMETAKSLSFDPANHSAHRFLSDAYVNIPRHEIARVSELLQAQLLQPINVNPVQPHLAVADLNIITNTGPAAAGFNEFAPLMERNKPQLVASGVVGSNRTVGDEIVYSQLYDKTSISLGQFHYHSDGFQLNNKQNHNIFNGFIQHAFSPKLNIQAEIRRRETDHGQILLDFGRNRVGQEGFRPDRRRSIRDNRARFGARYEISPNQDLLFSVNFIKRVDRPLNNIRSENTGYQFEAQHLFRHEYFNSILGGGGYRFKSDLEIVDFSSSSEFEDRENVYFYTNANLLPAVNLTLGLSYDSFNNGEDQPRVDKINPKIGVQWNILNNLRLRAAWFETSKSHLAIQQTIEPTQVAGFNQFFDDINGTRTKRMGVGLDYNLSATFFGGAEVTKRILHVPISGLQKQNEQQYRAYLYWLPHPRWSVRGEFQFERFKRSSKNVTSLLDTDPIEIQTLTAPLNIEYFHPSGIFYGLTGTFVQQDLRRLADLNSDEKRKPSKTFSGVDNFFMLDASIGYRFPKRRGIFSVEGRNLLNEDFFYRSLNFNPSEAVNPRYVPERTVFVRVTLNF